MESQTKTLQVKSKDNQSTIQENTISMCDILKTNTSMIIKKIEKQTPSNFQLYSDLYSEYLHLLGDAFGTCYLAEKEFFDKLGFDQNTLKVFDDFMNTMTGNLSTQIDLSNNFLRNYVKMRISAIRSYDNYVHIFMTGYVQMSSQFNLFFTK